jgi:hypothetical protein
MCQGLLLTLAARHPDPADVLEPASFPTVAGALGLAGVTRRRKQRTRPEPSKNPAWCGASDQRFELATNTAAPATMAAMLAHKGMLTVFSSATDRLIGPRLALCVSLVKLKPPSVIPSKPATMSTTPMILVLFIILLSLVIRIYSPIIGKD